MRQAFLFAPSQPAGGGGSGYVNTLQGAWVQDSAGNVYWLETATDSQGNVTYTYYDQPGGNVVTPTGDLEPVKDNNLQVIKRGDDVNGDSSLIVNFYRVNVYDDEGNIIASTPQTATGLPYTVQGVEVEPEDEIEALLSVGNNNTAAAVTELASIQTATVSTASSASEIKERSAGSFINFNFDEVDLTYVVTGAELGEIETATYKLATVVVGVVTITYDTSGNISNITRA